MGNVLKDNEPLGHNGHIFYLFFFPPFSFSLEMLNNSFKLLQNHHHFPISLSLSKADDILDSLPGHFLWIYKAIFI